MKQSTYYFSHDYNAANDVKILFLRQQLGMEGYGIFWYLIEALASAGGKLPLNITPVLAMQIQVTEIKVKAVIEQFELFSIEENNFFSSRLNEHLQLRTTLSEKGRLGAAKRWNNSSNNREAIGVANANEMKGNKENKRNSENFINKISI